MIDALDLIRATLDANVLVAAPLRQSERQTPPRAILDAWQAGRFELSLSEHIIAEIAHAHTKRYFQRRLSAADIDDYHRLLRRLATMVEVTAVVRGVAPHAADDIVLATAVSGGADYLVTGDEEFRKRVPSYQGVTLVSPAQFVAIPGLLSS